MLFRSDKDSFHVGELRLYQEADSTYNALAMEFGGLIVRNNLWAMLDGKACEATLNGIYLLNGEQHLDNYMWAEHVKENIPSHEVYKGVLDDNAHAVFSGRIYVHKEAQKTDAKQTNQNLLLTDTARVNTKPQLEIYADDVKCTHGATVGQLDQNSLFYLMSRGISKREARNLLIRAFLGELYDTITMEPVRERVIAMIDQKMPNG